MHEVSKRFLFFKKWCGWLRKTWHRIKATKLITSRTTLLLVVALSMILVALLLFYRRSNIIQQDRSSTITLPQQTPTVPTNSSPSPTPEPMTKSSLVPADVLDLSSWRLTLPIDTFSEGTPDEVSQPVLAKFSLPPYFMVNSTNQAVVFRAHAGGQTTNKSKYPRSELREMTSANYSRAAWSNTSGTHIMTIRQAITHLPVAKPEVVAGQIHDVSDDVVMIKLKSNRLYVESESKSVGVLDENYTLGKIFTLVISAQDNRILVNYNGSNKVNISKPGFGYYFKAGCYTQSNPSKGDDPNSYGEVMIYSLKVDHR